MLTELCGELRNWFIRDYSDVYRGEFVVSDGSVQPISFLQNGQYFRIIGSVFNDGVWKYPDDLASLHGETFDGEIWAMRVPKEVIDLSAEIDAWVADNSDAINSPYQSESFGGYSYSLKGSGTYGGSVDGTAWKSQFASKLAKWRKL